MAGDGVLDTGSVQIVIDKSTTGQDFVDIKELEMETCVETSK